MCLHFCRMSQTIGNRSVDSLYCNAMVHLCFCFLGWKGHCTLYLWIHAVPEQHRHAHAHYLWNNWNSASVISCNVEITLWRHTTLYTFSSPVYLHTYCMCFILQIERKRHIGNDVVAIIFQVSQRELVILARHCRRCRNGDKVAIGLVRLRRCPCAYAVVS